jgi:hypothetical protein
LGDGFLLSKDLAEGVVSIAVHNVLVHVGDGNCAAGPVEMIAVSAGRRCHREEAFAVSFHPEMALYRPCGVNLRVCLCGVPVVRLRVNP